MDEIPADLPTPASLHPHISFSTYTLSYTNIIVQQYGVHVLLTAAVSYPEGYLEGDHSARFCQQPLPLFFGTIPRG